MFSMFLISLRLSPPDDRGGSGGDKDDGIAVAGSVLIGTKGGMWVEMAAGFVSCDSEDADKGKEPAAAWAGGVTDAPLCGGETGGLCS